MRTHSLASLLLVGAALATSASLLSAQALPSSSSGAAAQLPRDDRSFSFYDRGPYRPAVPRPDSILGYPVGGANTQFAMQERVLQAIAAAAPDRVRIEEIGATQERRTMRLYIVSSPANIARLDAIRADLDRIADPRGATAAAIDAVVARTPVVVWINESVHGNESPGFETVMPLLYQLAASDDPTTLRALDSTIIVLNPSSNPDGHERFTVWYGSIATGDPNPGALEHREPWSIQGRFNHYRFDMNRDVIASTQREVQALLRGMNRWHPQVAVDQHGQTTNYFFPPAARPVNEHLGENATKWLDTFGRGNAAAFDKYGWMYFVRDNFDLYYPGYWDTWPSLTGATGMTYETDGGGWKGLRWRREDGTILTFRDGIAKHWVSALATIETAGARRGERLGDYARFRQSAVADGRTGRMQRVVIGAERDPGRAAELAAALVRAGVEVRRTTGAFSSARATSYADGGAAGSRRFAAGSYVIDMAQPQGRVARAILEPTHRLDSTFARLQLEKFRRNARRGSDQAREEYEFYDVTAWSLPVAFGVEAWTTEDAGPVTGDLVTLPVEQPVPVLGSAAGEMPLRADGEFASGTVPGGIVAGRDARSAYLFSSERAGSARLLAALLADGVRAAVATLPVEAGGKEWPRGTVIIRVARNDSTLAERLDRLARESGVEVTGINSAFTETSQYGIGSGAVTDLVAPRVALVGDEGVSQTAYGAIWWSLERRYGMRLSPINLDYVAGGDLSQYNVIIMPSTSPGTLRARLGKAGTDRLKAWVESGGTLMTMGRATAWAARADVGLTTARVVGAEAAEASAKSDSSAAASRPSGRDSLSSAARTREQTPDRALEALSGISSPGAGSVNEPAPVPGATFDVSLDRTHWLTMGYDRPRLTVLVDGDVFLTRSTKGANVAVFPASGNFLRAGFTWPDNTERLLRGTAFVVDESLGDGHVIAFAGEPMFRGWWRAMDRLVLNGVLMGPAF